ncbi:hypothetical protein RB25_22580 [Herbaspirillum rubrisubalbicans]|uniref:Type II secretion system protein GspC N-terminal domain-containing protein n=1 Tax=Herbaspirillum rubrisubalbicans TaxID=80842 RepID=A0ABX9C5C2_9BURK|nr:pilus assembly protein PilP [Herbaspirillum rubrisubalbicans]RAM65706.1 hypothetical protein RB24_05750 [Herbaspirillum rubrisubalbicans]RAN43867.1 hypothetical protein RB25_22580 [Herbaspirillum rubrisubalbicans]
MKLLSLTLSPLLLAAAVYGTLQAVQHPDEAAATRIWMESARPLPPPPLPAMPAAPAPASTPPVSDDSELADPFHPQQDAHASQPRRAPPSADEEDDEASPSHTSAPPAASAALAPPTLRLLGTLRRDQHWTAIAELDGATHRLQVGDMLPGGLGQVMAVREEQIDIAHAGNTRTISMASSTGTASPALAPPSATFPAKTSRASRFTARKPKRRLIRPGVTP